MFFPDVEEYSSAERLRALGVRSLEFVLGRTSDGSIFTNVTSVIPVKEQAVDVEWFKQAQDLCDGMGPQLVSKTMSVAGAEDGDEDMDFRDEIADGSLWLSVCLRFDKEAHLSVDVYVPAGDLEVTPAGE